MKNVIMAAVCYQCSECCKYFSSLAFLRQHNCCRTADQQLPAAILSMSTESTTALTSRPVERRTGFQCDVYKMWFNDNAAYAQHECTGPMENADQSEGLTPSPVSEPLPESVYWTKAATALLIAQVGGKINQVNTGKMKMNQMFKEVAQTLARELGMKCSEQQASNKWKSLKRSYKEIEDHNNKSGNDGKIHPFQSELDAILKMRPNITPVATASSSSSSSEEGKDPKNVKKGKKRKLACDAQSTEEGSHFKTRHTQVSEVVAFLKDYAENQEKRYEEECNRQERMHTERISVFKDLINAFKDK